MILVPTTFYLYVAHPSWAWLYMIEPEGIPGFAILPLVVSHAAMMVGGWYLGARLVIADRHKLATYIAAGGALISVLGVVLLWGRLGHYGSYREYHDGRAIELMDVKLGYVLVALLLAIVSSATFVAIELVRDSRRAVSR